MHRHVVEPFDADSRTTIRHADARQLLPLEPSACAVYFGASYHADYATVLAHPTNVALKGDRLYKLLHARN